MTLAQVKDDGDSKKGMKRFASIPVFERIPFGIINKVRKECDYHRNMTLRGWLKHHPWSQHLEAISKQTVISRRRSRKLRSQ
jgi:hypothetical protein